MNGGLVNRYLLDSAVDGPGNRLVIFLQGCNFDCVYCHNPETINVCNNCGACIDSCPAGALTLARGTVDHNPAVCTNCGACLAACPRHSSPQATLLSLAEIEQLLNENAKFISGITVSGGEATCQDGFVIEVFKAARKRNLSAFLDTNGYVSTTILEAIMSHGDMAMVDLKAYDPAVHRSLTGLDNERILKNITMLAGIGKLYEVRTVVVPELLDNETNIREIGGWLAQLDPGVRYKLIGFRPVGVRAAAKQYPEPTPEQMAALKATATGCGLQNVHTV